MPIIRQKGPDFIKIPFNALFRYSIAARLFRLIYNGTLHQLCVYSKHAPFFAGFILLHTMSPLAASHSYGFIITQIHISRQ